MCIARLTLRAVRAALLPPFAALSAFTAGTSAALAGPPSAMPGAVAANPPNAPALTGPPRILFAGMQLPVKDSSAAPYRDPADKELCVTPQALAPLGASYIVDTSAHVVTFVGAEGAGTVTVPIRTPPASIPGRSGVFVAAVAVIEGLGGKCEWYPATNTLMARAILTGVEILGGQLRIKATLPVLPTVTATPDGRQVVIDIVGAEVGSLSRTPDLQAPNVERARIGQFQDDVARVVLELRQPGGFKLLDGRPSLLCVLNPSLPPGMVAPPSNPAPPATVDTDASHRRPGIGLVSGVTFHKISDTEAQFLISADRAPTVRAALANGRLTLDLINATLASGLGDIADCDHPFLRAAHLLANGTTAAQLVLDLTRAVVYTIRPSEKGPVELDLTLPRGAMGKLSGKTIVVDPGHGGHDSGAPGLYGTYEKYVNLDIAMQVVNALRDAGANVILTRSGDYFIPVDDRPQIANKAGADFFVSIHSDSGDHNHSIHGAKVYYHFNQPSCRTLAQCIADHMAMVGDIASKGIGSDGIRFPGMGYGVLRNSQMVAVLVECGYMSNGEDVRKLTDPGTQRRIANAIVAGLRDYIEGNPRGDTRDVNPQPAPIIAVPPPPASDPDAIPANASGTAPASGPAPFDPVPSGPKPSPPLVPVISGGPDL